MRVPYTIQINNIVASVDLYRRLNLTEIVKRYSTAEYRPEQFPGLVYRLWDPKVAMLIFSSGKMVCTGAKSVEDAKRAVKKVTKDPIEKCFGKQLEPPYIEVQNIVASGNFDKRIIIDQIIRLHTPRYSTMYEPEQFPGAETRDSKRFEKVGPDDKKIVIKENPVFLLFDPNKYISVGCTTQESLTTRIGDLYKTLFELELLEDF
jgi:transcription initiation factor TFIID TATA-box-binding protein